MSRTRHEGWDTALDAQTDLLRSFQTREGREYLNGFITSLANAGMFDSRSGELAPPDPQYAEFIVGHATGLLSECDPIYVSPDLTELIDYAADTFQPEPLVPTDLLVPSGFAYFSKPLFVRDRRDLEMPFRAVQWNPIIDVPGVGGKTPTRDELANGQHVYSGVVIALYAHCNDPDPMDDHRPWTADVKVGGSDLAMEYVTTLRFNQQSKVYESDNSVRDLLSHIKVFFRLCQQTIAVPRHERVARPTWKRARASWKDIKEVVVFTLRRAKPPKYEGEEREVQWSHRWLVQGHWRNQWYSSEKVHRQIWIAPFIKGPDDKPLIFKRRAFELVR
jgi:hypothetical protein